MGHISNLTVAVCICASFAYPVERDTACASSEPSPFEILIRIIRLENRSEYLLEYGLQYRECRYRSDPRASRRSGSPRRIGPSDGPFQLNFPTGSQYTSIGNWADLKMPDGSYYWRIGLNACAMSGDGSYQYFRSGSMTSEILYEKTGGYRYLETGSSISVDDTRAGRSIHLHYSKP